MCIYLYNIIWHTASGHESYAQFAVDNFAGSCWASENFVSQMPRDKSHTRTNFHTRERCVHTLTCTHTHTHVQRHVQLDTVVYTFAAHLIAALGQLACGCLAWRLCLQIFAQMFANLTQVSLPALPSPLSILSCCGNSWQLAKAIRRQFAASHN